MRSNHLLSLLAHGQEGRVKSLAHRQAASPTFSFLPRSNSSSLNKGPARDQHKMSTQFVKVFHLLNVKVKQSYFFSFCKIQQLAKNRSKKQDNIAQPEENPQSAAVQQQKTQHINAIDKVAAIGLGLNKLCEFQSTLSSKLWQREKYQLLLCSFKRLLRYSGAIQLAGKLQRFVKERALKAKRQLFKGAQLVEKEKIRLQILTDILLQLQFNCKSKSFRSLKGWRPKQQQRRKQATPEEKKQELADEFVRRKVLLKQKKSTATARPIAAYVLYNLRPFTAFSQDQPLLAGQMQSSNQTEHMKRFIHQKPEQMASPLPDLPDSFCIFGQLKEQTNKSRMKSTFLIHKPQEEVNQFLPNEESPAELQVQDQVSKRAAGYSKHKSMCSMLGNKSSVSELSPLMRVEELLRNMKNIEGQKSRSKEKKMVNINIPRELNEYVGTPSRQHTPCRKCSRQLQQYVSADKQNIGVRLFTQKPKHEEEGSGLDSIKIKSTVLPKEKKDKGSSQMFTARKMKLQIQNIINKRNRQQRQNLRHLK